MATRNRRRREALSPQAVEVIAERFRILGDHLDGLGGEGLAAAAVSGDRKSVV